MNKVELIELIKDQLGEMRINQARKHFHPEIIAYTLDKQYWLLLSQAYASDPYSIDGCLDVSYNVPVYADTNTQDLFSVIPKYVIPLHSVQGGVWNVKKHGDSSVKFEPYSSDFENRSWNRLSVNFANTVRFWFDRGAPDTELSASSASNSATFSDYQSLVWFKAETAQLTNDDTVDIKLLPTFYAHGDTQQVYVPANVGGVKNLVDVAIGDLLRKLGIQSDYNQRESNEE